MTTSPIKLAQGTQLALTMTAQDSSGVALPLTGSKIVFSVRSSDDVIMTKEITETSDEFTVGKITDPANGVFTIFFTTTDTESAVAGKYYLRWYTVDGSENNTMIQGNPCDIANFEICRAG